jgi:Zn finger protein HypA/HybF involved in hydrogenase expression
MSKKYHSACEACDKIFTKDNQNAAEQALRMHIGVVHKGTIRRGRRKAEVVAGAKVRRPYTKRQKQPQAQEVAVNYCPNCGCNLHAVATGIAMALVGKH